MEKLIFRAKNWPRLIRRVGLLAGKYGISLMHPHNLLKKAQQSK